MEDQEKPYKKYKSSRLRSRGKPLKVKQSAKEARGSGGSRSQASPAHDKPATGARPQQPGSSQPPASGKPLAGKPRRSRRVKKVFLFSLLALLLAALAVPALLYWRLDRAVAASNAKVPPEVHQVLKKPAGGIMSGPVNILFLGSDERPDEPARADTILITRVNGGKKTISQLSIPRDTLVDIPGYGEGKINSAYAYGGPALMIETVEQFTGIPINHYVELNFAGFPGIIDSVGGVEINVPSTIDAQYPAGYDWTTVHFDAGPQHMSGERALQFVRVRYSDNDFKRMERQQLFMESLQKKFTAPGNMVRLPVTAPDIIGNMITDLPTNDILRLGWVKFRTPASGNRKFVLGGSGEYIGDVSYVVMDEEQSQAVIRDFLSG